ncbi:right-handed parallel beta-helix repeat-containing protein [Nonomuraea fuscirosea]|uniref:right-handed parallel beta-helix repeat-containing protein n=1 Tax=Nonomuraea fuscirosea TaxID=1291556 RepID=UPI002DD87F35|nr:right-handed parallel beta-helix repeat-containing protein [Nonomuraea fuscirosea]WSA53439.1 right-handed parallel beta-helix repeat-containing protein [Nonomuraea fuscirosea]
MPRRVTIPLVAALLLAGALPALPAAATSPAQTVVYVAKTGKDDATGTEKDPFATIERARDALTGRTSERRPGVVRIREGVYQTSRTIEVTGPGQSYVTYAAYPGERVELAGVTTLAPEKFRRLSDVPEGEAKWSSRSRVPAAAASSVYVYDLGAEGIPTGTLNKNGFNWKPQPFAPQLITDDVAQTLAQYPNGDAKLDRTHVTVKEAPKGARDYFSDKTADGTTLPYEDMLKLPGPVYTVADPAVAERHTTWAKPAGATEPDSTQVETDGWLAGYFGNNYANDRVRIDQAGGNELRTTYPTMYVATDKWTSFVAQNVLSELDAEGEYYIDRWQGHDTLYYYPPGGTVEGRTISLTSFDAPFFELENVRGVTLEGLKLNGTTGTGVRLLDAESCTIDGLEILNVSMDAVQIGEANDAITAIAEYRTSRGGHRNRVVDSRLHDLGGGGVFTAGGDRDSLERGDHVVEHNEIYDFSKLATYTPAGYMYGVGNTFRYNDVHDAPHMAIQIMGNDMEVSHNRFERLVTHASDQGVIYAGRDYTYLNNVISHNLFRDIGADGNQAVYMDDGMSGMVVHHNFFDTVQHGLFYQSGHSNVAADNVFKDVRYIGHDKLYHEGGKRLPVANAKVVVERFNDMLKVGDGTGFTNTRRNVEKWYRHYARQYPNIRAWYVPSTADGRVCTEVGATECTDEQVWSNPDSVYVPANNVLTRSVSIGTGDFAYTDDAGGLSVKTFNPDFDSYNVKGAGAAELGFDPATGRFDARTTPLNSAEGFGRAWVKEWNRTFTLDGIGPAAS